MFDFLPMDKESTPWTVAYEAPPSIEFSRQEHWSGVPFPSLGDLPDPGIEPGSPALQEDVLTVWATVICIYVNLKILIYPAPSFPFGDHKVAFYVCVSILLCK